MCMTCAKINGMKRKKKSGRRRARVSGVGSGLKGLFTQRTLIPAAAVLGVSYFAADNVPDSLKTPMAVKAETVLGGLMVFTNLLGRSPLIKGLGLGMAIDGGKKWSSGNDWKGNPLPEASTSGVSVRSYLQTNPRGVNGVPVRQYRNMVG